MRGKSIENERIELSDGRVIHDSRSNACALALFKHVGEKTYVLCIKRGDSVEESGKWSIPCGYLNRNESLIDCAFREFYEETGFDIDDDFTQYRVTNAFIDDDYTKSKRQNVTFYYAVHYFDNVQLNEKSELYKLINYTGNKPIIDTNNETTEIDWVVIDKLDDGRDWAYDANNIIKKVYILSN